MRRSVRVLALLAATGLCALAGAANAPSAGYALPPALTVTLTQAYDRCVADTACKAYLQSLINACVANQQCLAALLDFFDANPGLATKTQGDFNGVPRGGGAGGSV